MPGEIASWRRFSGQSQLGLKGGVFRSTPTRREEHSLFMAKSQENTAPLRNPDEECDCGHQQKRS
jgi:hypothetical protein